MADASGHGTVGENVELVGAAAADKVAGWFGYSPDLAASVAVSQLPTLPAGVTQDQAVAAADVAEEGGVIDQAASQTEKDVAADVASATDTGLSTLKWIGAGLVVVGVVYVLIQIKGAWLIAKA